MNKEKDITRKPTGGELEVFEFLDELKSSGDRNMFDNLAHVIEDEFGYVREESKRLGKLWTINHDPTGKYITVKD